MSQFASLCSDPLEEVVDEGVHDAHSLGGHASVRVNLFQYLRENKFNRVQSKENIFNAHLVNVDCVRFFPLSLLLFLLALGRCLSSFARLEAAFPEVLGGIVLDGRYVDLQECDL